MTTKFGYTVALLFGLLVAARAQTPTRVTLSAVMLPSGGQAMVLRAVVFPQVSVGSVAFLDGSRLLGVRNVVAGAATLTILPLPAGAHSLRAVYVGTGAYARSESRPFPTIVRADGGLPSTGSVSTRLVAAAPVTSLVLASSANPSTFGHSITLTATITPNNATGKVEFLDGVNLLGVGTLNAGQAHISTSLLPSGSRSLIARYGSVAQSNILVQTVTPAAAYSWLVSSTPNVAAPPYSVVLGDFNGDGKADLAVANGGNALTLLGSGSGTFTQKSTFVSSPYALAVADFNGDGKADLAAVNQDTQTVDILLGNGDGTVTLKSSPATGTTPYAVAAADFNGDGIADVAVVNLDDSTVTMLLGHGDGTFTAAAPINTGAQPVALAVADFNGDGKADLAVANSGDGNLSILLGNGDGTFSAAPLLTGGGSQNFAVGDFNGDGKADLAVPNDAGAVDIFLGNGNGTFAAGASLTIPSGVASVLAADLNGDGLTDLALMGSSTKQVTILAGNGNGTFSPLAVATTGSFPDSLAVGDFNGDGRADLIVANYSSNTISVLLGQPSALSVTETHNGTFTQGQQGATFTITVSNAAGAQTTSGTVTVTETTSSDLTFVGMAGDGWTCPAKTCTRNDGLAGGVSYPPITLTVNFKANAFIQEANLVTVSGGTSGSATFTDLFYVIGSVLSLTKIHNGDFGRGQQGVTYSLTVSNAAGAKTTTGYVTVTEVVPTGLTLVSMSGTGWGCYTPNRVCMRNDGLAAGASYLPITVTMNVDANAPLQLTNQASVVADNAVSVTASDPTTIEGSPCDLNDDGSTTVADVQRGVNESLGVILRTHDLNHDGVMNVPDLQIVINAVLNKGCSAS